MKLTGQRNQCPTCGEYFNSNAAFDKHRVGPHKFNQRRCMTKEEMAGAGMVLREDGFWRGSVMPENIRG